MYATAVNKEGSIKIYYQNFAKSLWVSTGVTGIPNDEKYFNDERLTSKVKDYTVKNLKIAEKHGLIEDIIKDYVKYNDIEPSIEYVKQKLRNKNEKTEAAQQLELKKSDSFLPYYKAFYEEKGREIRVKDSLKDYISNLNTLLAYEKMNGKLTLQSINDVKFLKAFELFLSKPINQKIKVYKGTKERTVNVKGELNDNTISKRISYIKVFLNWCEQNDHLILHPKIKAYKTIVSKYKPTIVILTDEELKQLKNLDLKNETDAALRDYMLVLCSTGMRFSDLYSLSKEDVEGGYITKRAQKTRIIFSVPISDETLAIIKKYEYSFKRFKNQTYNRMIKDLLRENKMCCYNVTVTTAKFNVIKTTEVEKCEEIGTHTGRRTFVARALKNGWSLADVMSCTGHKKIETLLVYRDLFAKEDSKRERFLQSLSI
jgi:integrase